MKVKCGVVEDLLPLYIDNVCSEESKELVEEHLGECESCSAKLKSQRDDLIVSEDVIRENLKSKRPFKKIKRNGAIGFISTVICIVLIFLTLAEVSGDGVGFSALIGRYKASRVLTLMEKGEFQRAAEHLRFDGGIYENINNKEEAKKQWVSGMQSLRDDGIEIISHSNNRIKTDDGFTSGFVNISVKYNNITYPFRIKVYTNAGRVEFGDLTYTANYNPAQIENMLIERISKIIVTYFPG